MAHNPISSRPAVFAILLPVVCRGNNDDTLRHLRRFATSLVRTSLQEKEGTRSKLVVYLSIHRLDHFLLGPTTADPSVKAAEHVLLHEKVPEVITIVRDQHLGSSSHLWADSAQRAFEDGCDFMAFMTHDAELPDEPWIEAAYTSFTQFSASSGAPFGFGCVALSDATGLPTCPIVHRTHIEIFRESIMPDISVDEGAEFLFQLYRRFGCSKILSCQVSNIASDLNAKSFDASLKDWTFETLNKATSIAEVWLRGKGSKCQRLLTLDVVIPSFRVTISYLREILDLKASKSCSVMYFIIIDNPVSPHIPDLRAVCSNRYDTRIRVNDVNMGTSATRNRGINESAAEWIHFLDDDIVPGEDLFLNVERHVRAHPNACGFIGVTNFPVADEIWKAALHISAAIYYFSVAKRLPSDVPWSVSANLVARRDVRDGVRFKALYPKTGGGEDIDFCMSKRIASKAHGGEGFVPAPDIKVVHPWWPAARGAYWRFYVWSYGDELLCKEFPQYTYIDYVPNSAECLLFCLLGGTIATVSARWKIAAIALKAAFCILLSHTVHDCFRHLVLHPERLNHVHTTVRGVRWFVAVVESSYIRFFREVAWFHGMIDHGRYNFFRRFDINGGRLGNTAINEERKIRMQKLVLTVLGTLCLAYCC